jgi:hypothetical protein
MEPEEEHLITIIMIILIREIVRDSNATLFTNDFSKDANKLSSEKFIILCVHIYPRDLEINEKKHIYTDSDPTFLCNLYFFCISPQGSELVYYESI